ncbi:MAG: hypothetical protein FJ240_13670 [Nitrospira sp.]|nr:hypothetical protein [Nitrospira sp.]
MFLLNNKWNEGKAQFDFSQIDTGILSLDGIFTLPVMLSPKIGYEVVIVLIDHTSFIYELAQMKPFNMFLKSGLGNTSCGPILFNLFIFIDKDSPLTVRPDQAELLVDIYANPCDTQSIKIWHDLASQSHWHLFLVDGQAKQIEFFEFKNTFNLDKTLSQVMKACKGMTQTNFMNAKQEFMNKYEVEDLFRMM